MIWRAYLQLLEKRPLFTKSLTSGVLLGIGDLIGQVNWFSVLIDVNSFNSWSQSIFEKKKENIDVKRTSRSTAIGFCEIGPMMHVW